MPELVESTAYWLYSPDEAEQQRPGSGRAQGIVESLSQRLSLRFRTHTETHRQQAPHGWISTPHEAITGTRSLHDDAWAPRQLLPPSRAARACCAGRCLVSYILHSLWFPAQAPDILLPSVLRYRASFTCRATTTGTGWSGRRLLSRAPRP